jgi:predicted RNA-binding Zn-ribbon protein involved in translation (DUF1610 family)
MDTCPAAWAPPVPPELCLTLDLDSGESGLWGVVAPPLQWGNPPVGPGKIHVHHRPTSGDKKDIDASFDLVDLHYRGKHVQVEGVAAKARSISELSGVEVQALACTHCGEIHIDELMFATRLHRLHQCNSCGHTFVHAVGQSVSNPLADVFTLLGVPQPPAPVRAAREIEITTDDYAAVALWPSNKAFISTMTRPEEVGIHVHAWKADVAGEPDVDETYGKVTINGVVINEDDLRLLAVQRELADGRPIMAADCATCGAALRSPTTGWMQPTTTHVCSACGATTRTARRVFLNPLADKF